MNARLALAVCALMALATTVRADDLAITYEVRIVTVSGEAMPGFVSKEGTISSLSNDELEKLLNDFQGRARVGVMQAPRMTADDGQAASLRVINTMHFVTGLDAVRVQDQVVMVPKNAAVETEVTLSLTGIVRPDREGVLAKIKFTHVQRLCNGIS